MGDIKMSFLVRCLFLLIITQSLSKDPLFDFVVWNVGQGAWSTYYNADRCLHFDMGGESFPWPKILQLCGSKENQIYLTHEDWDHINGLRRFHLKVPNSCVYYPKPRQRKYPKSLKQCPSIASEVKIVSFGETNKGRNASSLIYLLRNKVLISGDASQKEEKKWSHKLPATLFLLILGHHGSNTSTSNRLLQDTQPRMAVASARQSKYGHPHPMVQRRLKTKRVSMLRTETLGSIFFKID